MADADTGTSQYGTGDAFPEGSKGSTPLDLPEVQLSVLYPDIAEDAILENEGLVGGPGIQPDAAPSARSDGPPIEYEHVDAVTNTATLLADTSVLRRVLTLVGIGTAAQVELSNMSNFGKRTFIGAGSLPVDVPLPAGHQLWIRQVTVITQTIDYYVESRGPGR